MKQARARLLSLFSISMLCFGVARADDPCAFVDTVLRAVADKFTSIDGGPFWADEPDGEYRKSTIVAPGATGCVLDRYEDLRNLDCDWSYSRFTDETTLEAHRAGLMDLVTSCVMRHSGDLRIKRTNGRGDTPEGDSLAIHFVKEGRLLLVNSRVGRRDGSVGLGFELDLELGSTSEEFEELLPAEYWSEVN